MKNVLVIGGSSGIGAAIVDELLEQDYRVTATFRSHEISLDHPNLFKQRFDVLEDDPSSIQMDEVDAIVYAPGSIDLKPFNRFEVSDLQSDLQLNALAAFNVINIVIAFLICVLGFVRFKILNGNLYRNIEWPVIILLAAMVPIGQALQSTGITQQIAVELAAYTGSLSLPWILLIVLVFTMLVSDILNNAATAIIMAPIAVELAIQLQAPLDAFLMAVAIGASCAFLSPIGHQCNTLVMAPGKYKFSDYWRIGLPLELIIAIISIPMIMFIWG